MAHENQSLHWRIRIEFHFLLFNAADVRTFSSSTCGGSSPCVHVNWLLLSYCRGGQWGHRNHFVMVSRAHFLHATTTTGRANATHRLQRQDA